jgi:hypothetical protein
MLYIYYINKKMVTKSQKLHYLLKLLLARLIKFALNKIVF